MKRSDMVSYLHKLLNTYEDCKLDKAVADEVLEGLENIGMMPPGRNQDEIVARTLSGKVIGVSHDQYVWDEE